ncbi:hypothetical protein K1719_023850 [Acacia pycnantha]|nr:hypothetical protein K1719_023850 [Acacia pycnantha]
MLCYLVYWMQVFFGLYFAFLHSISHALLSGIHDARVFRHAIESPTMNFPHPPEGKYYLVDSGYPTPVGYIGPYKRFNSHRLEIEVLPVADELHPRELLEAKIFEI